MDKLIQASKTYFETLFKTGYLPQRTVNNLLILDFITELKWNPDYELMATIEEKGIVNNIYRCIMQNNCLII